MCQEKRGGKSDEPLQLYLCADGHQFSPCRRHNCIISSWKRKSKKRGSGEWELHCPSCRDCTYAPAVRKTHTRWEFRKNKKHNWCEVVRNRDKKSFKAIIKLSCDGTEYAKLKDGMQKTSCPTKSDELNMKAGSAHAGLPRKLKHNAQPLKVAVENGKTCRYRKDEGEHKREIQYRTKWKYRSVTKDDTIVFDFIPHATAKFPKRKLEGKVVMVNGTEITVHSEIRDLCDESTGRPKKIRTNYKLLARHYNCKLSVCQLYRRGPDCGCKPKDVVPPEIILLHNKLNESLSPNLDGPARVLSCTKAETNANTLCELARELDKHIAAVPSESPIAELWRKFRDKLQLHENASGEYSGANPVSSSRRVRESSPGYGSSLSLSSYPQHHMAIGSSDLSPDPMTTQQPITIGSTDLSPDPMATQQPMAISSTDLPQHPMAISSTDLSPQPMAISSTDLSPQPMATQQPMAIGSSDLSPHPMAISSTDLPVPAKKHRTAVDDSSSEFRSQDSKPELNKIFGDGSNEWSLDTGTANPSLYLMGAMAPDTQPTKDGDGANASVGEVQKEKSERDSSLEGFAKGLSSEFSSISLSSENLNDVNSNSKSVNSDSAVPLHDK